MSELIKERLKNSLGKTILIFLDNNFRYYGKLVNYDEQYVELLDFKTSSYKLIKIAIIKEIEVGDGTTN